jgi:hypothetical protein
MAGDKLISDDFRKEMMHVGGPKAGWAICGSPFEMVMIFDFTGLRGSGSNMYYGYVYQVPKWNYNIAKVDEWISVTPEWAEYYSLTLGQKQKLMETIKAGLASAASSVADYELAMHDVRRYKEIIDYFKAAQKDEHVLRSLFVDRVDAHTGEGYSLISMARRWPTIITDFIRMKEEWTDPKKIPVAKDQIQRIKEELDVSQAEATVLKTKNELFRQWKTAFRPTVVERYARMQNLVDARKASIDEYRNWMKPYLARFKMMKEKMETVSPADELSNPYMTPGFGQSQASTGVKLWLWKPMPLGELRKAEMGPLKPVGTANFVVNPYDDMVKKWLDKINAHWGTNITDVEILGGKDEKGNEHKGLLKEWTEYLPPNNFGRMDKFHVYYVFFEVTYWLNLVKTPPPEAMETDNVMFYPLRGWFMSQNSLLVHLLEIEARNRAFEAYVNQMLGLKEAEEDIIKRVEAEIAGKAPEKPNLKKFQKVRGWGGTLGKGMDKFAHLYVKRGPYEPVFKERVSKLMARGMGAYYKQQLDHIQALMGAK